MNNETEPRDGGFTQEELDSQKPYFYYDTWINWWRDLTSN